MSTTQNSDALYAGMIAARSGGASGGAALTKADFQGSLSSTSLDGGSLMGQMAGMFGSNGQVSADQLQTVLKILAGQGTQPSQEAKSTASTPAGQDAIAKLD